MTAARRHLRALRSAAGPVLVFALLAALPSPAVAIDATLAIEMSSAGAFTGENTGEGREGTIQVLGYADRHSTPTDLRTGGALGPPECGPLVIRKLVDRTTPLFLAAWYTNDTSTSFELVFYEAGTAYFKISLSNARVVAISRAGAEDDAVPQEQISFVYASAVYEHLSSGNVGFVSCFGAS